MPNMEDTKKFQQLLAIAQSGDTEAMFDVADDYFHGNGVEKNLLRSFEWTKKAAEAGSPKAMHNLAIAYKDGLGVEEDMSRYFAWTKKAAESDSLRSMHNLAIAYKDGWGVEKNPQQFSEWTKKAAEAGLPEAMFNLALAYGEGLGVEKDMSQSFAWMEKAAEADLPEAMFGLALAYKKGLGVEKDRSQYFAWTKKAAEAGFRDAMFNLAFAYKDGLSGGKNPERFFHWVEKAYKKGVVDAAIIFPISRLWQSRKIKKPTHDKIVDTLLRLRKECKRILQKKHKVDEGQPLSHYTKFAVLDSVLEGGGSNHLRLYNVAYFNDSLEGAAFPSALGHEICKFIYDRKNRIPHEITVEGKKFSVYACAFSAHDDHLPLWIAYGNNGDGYNITGTIPQHMKADKESGAMQEMHRSFSLAKDETAAEKSKDARIRVYKVQYSKAAENTAQKLTPRLKELQSILQGKGDEVIQAAKDAAEWILADLRYLYKHKAYRWEKEYRIIRVAEFGDEKMESDDRTPPRLYLKTLPFLFLENGCKITVGPRVAKEAAPELYIRRQLTKNGWDKTTKTPHSKMPYR